MFKKRKLCKLSWATLRFRIRKLKLREVSQAACQGLRACQRQSLDPDSSHRTMGPPLLLLQGNNDPGHSCGRWGEGEWEGVWGDIGRWYLRLPCWLEILNLECGTSGFGWLEGCGVRGWSIGPRRPKLFSPTGSSGSSRPRSVETGTPLDVNTQSPCLDRPVAPTRGRYLRGSRSQSPRALGAGGVSGLSSHRPHLRPPCSGVDTSSQSTESKDSRSYLEPEKNRGV